MKVISGNNALRSELQKYRNDNKKISFVSTMGALHKGHTSLVTKAKSISDIVVASIFLNPLHFSENEDFDKYPRTVDTDCEKLMDVGCDIAWIPTLSDLYPFGLDGQVRVNIPSLGYSHCGQSRPHFFEAVATIVTKELNVVMPDFALFGERITNN